MKSLMKNGLFYMKEILADIAKNGVTGADDHSESSESLHSGDFAFEENENQENEHVENVDENQMTRQQRIQLRKQKERILTGQLNDAGDQNQALQYIKEQKEMQKKDRKRLKKQTQAIIDEYGSEAYFCGSSCSECDICNHQESEKNELEPSFQREDSEEQKEAESEQIQPKKRENLQGPVILDNSINLDNLEPNEESKSPQIQNKSSFKIGDKKDKNDSTFTFQNQDQSLKSKLSESKISKISKIFKEDKPDRENQSPMNIKQSKKISKKRSIDQISQEIHLDQSKSKSKRGSFIPANRNYIGMDLNRSMPNVSGIQSIVEEEYKVDCTLPDYLESPKPIEEVAGPWKKPSPPKNPFLVSSAQASTGHDTKNKASSRHNLSSEQKAKIQQQLKEQSLKISQRKKTEADPNQLQQLAKQTYKKEEEKSSIADVIQSKPKEKETLEESQKKMREQFLRNSKR